MAYDARALSIRPKLLLLDEPSSLDALTRGGLQEQLKIAQENQLTCIMVTHDVDEALLLDRIVLLTNGVILGRS